MADEPTYAGAIMPLNTGAVTTTSQDDEGVFQLVEERLTVGKRVVEGGTIRVSTRTETRDESVEVILDRAEVHVERVSVGRPVDAAPPMRHEGDTMIVPVIEERLVVTKQLYLVEELRIRQTMTQETVKTSVPLRRQHAVVERTDADGKPLPGDPVEQASLSSVARPGR